MKKFLITFFILFFSCNLFAYEKTLKFGVSNDHPGSKDSWGLFVKFLSSKTGADIQLVYENVDELIAKLSTGEIAFANLSSSAFAISQTLYKNKIKYVVTAAERNEKGKLVPYYKGYFYVLKDSSYKSLFDLKGKPFGFVNKTSNSGYIYPLSVMSGMGINPDNYFSKVIFTEDHYKIFEALKNGSIDGGVSNYDAYEKARVLYGNIFRVIGETSEIPLDAIAVSSSTDPKLVKKVEGILLNVKPEDPGVNYPGFLYKGWIKKLRTSKPLPAPDSGR